MNKADCSVLAPPSVNSLAWEAIAHALAAPRALAAGVVAPSEGASNPVQLCVYWQ